jgi:hypothetical protein
VKVERKVVVGKWVKVEMTGEVMIGLEVVFDLKARDDQAMLGLEVVFDLKARDD